MRTYRDYLTPKLDPINGRPVFPLSFSDRPIEPSTTVYSIGEALRHRESKPQTVVQMKGRRRG